MQERRSACRPVASATARVACKQVAACKTNETGRRSREVGRQRRAGPTWHVCFVVDVLPHFAIVACRQGQGTGAHTVGGLLDTAVARMQMYACCSRMQAALQPTCIALLPRCCCCRCRLLLLLLPLLVCRRRQSFRRCCRWRWCYRLGPEPLLELVQPLQRLLLAAATQPLALLVLLRCRHSQKAVQAGEQAVQAGYC